MQGKNILYFSVFVLLSSCLSTDDIIVKQDADLTQLAQLNVTLRENLTGRKVKKTITIDGELETKVIDIDSVFIQKEFSKFANIDIEKVFLNGEYLKSVSGLKPIITTAPSVGGVAATAAEL